jgi:hypothetical protein
MRRRARLIVSKLGKRWLGLGLWALLMALLAAGSVSTAGAARAAAHADPPSNGAIDVIVPVPTSDGKTVVGPVHTNVSVAGSQATAGATFELGWADPSAGCVNGFNAFTNPAVSVTADSGGGFAATFVWPSSAGTPGALYQICARDTANPATDVITANQVFQALGSTAPQITLQRVPVPTPSPTPTDKGFHAGSPIVVKGKGFLPQGTPIAIFVTTSSRFSPQDYQPDNALKTVDGSAIVSDSQGQFTAQVILPTIPGQQFLYAVSPDANTSGQTPFPPSLVASRTILIGAPLPTPTPVITPTPDTHGGNNTGTPGETMRIIAIATLGLLSLVLFIIGGILVASATLGARKPPKPDIGNIGSGGRSGPQW